MANLTPDEIAEALANVIAGAEGQGIVITDKRFSESNTEWPRLLKSQAATASWRGWLLPLLSVPSQTDEGVCDVEITYRFAPKFFLAYESKPTAGVTSDQAFRTAIFNAIEALNRSRDLGLGSQVRHQGLQSLEDFDIEDIGGGPAGQLCHTAPFILDVRAINSY